MELTTVGRRATRSLSAVISARKYAISLAHASNHGNRCLRMAVGLAATSYALSANTGARHHATQVKSALRCRVRQKCAICASVGIGGCKFSANLSLIEFLSSVTLVAGKSKEMRKSLLPSQVKLHTSKTKTKSSLSTILKSLFSLLRKTCSGVRRLSRT